jgi:ArsR family transcriptional regulator
MRLIEIYNCLCDETRLRIVHLLTRGPLCVCHFQQALKLPQVAVSKHLAYLRRHGLVEARRHQQWMIYSLPVNPPPELERHLRCLQDCAPAQPVFAADLRRLEKLEDCCRWVGAALPDAKPVNGRKAVAVV